MTEIEILLKCLIDEIKHGGNEPSELTIDVLSQYEDKYDFVKEFFNEFDKEYEIFEKFYDEFNKEVE